MTTHQLKDAPDLFPGTVLGLQHLSSKCHNAKLFPFVIKFKIEFQEPKLCIEAAII